MFDTEKAIIEQEINKILTKNRINPLPLVWVWIPSAVKWGLATSFFKIASANLHYQEGMPVSKRAEEISNLVVKRTYTSKRICQMRSC